MNEQELLRITSNDPRAACDPAMKETRDAWLAFGSLLEAAVPQGEEPLQTWRRASRRRNAWRGLLAAFTAAASVAAVALLACILLPSGPAPTEEKTAASPRPARSRVNDLPPWDDDWDMQIESVRRRVLLFEVNATTSAECEVSPLSRRLEALREELRTNSI
jgi:hypothetical protein